MKRLRARHVCEKCNRPDPSTREVVIANAIVGNWKGRLCEQCAREWGAHTIKPLTSEGT